MNPQNPPWWQGAVIYQIYPRSFADANGDGIGDLQGVRARLDYLAELGVDGLWLSPVFRSPMADAGYDISDYCDIDPLFGSLDEMQQLIDEAHARGLKVLLDFVPNHTSDQHPWFLESRASPDNPKRDWYIWRDEPNNWRAALGAGSAWSWDEPTQQYYLHLFLPQQPDLNWRNPAVVEAMHGVLRFWLDRGVDGFRIDVIHCTAKDETFADDPRCLAGLPLSDFNDQPYSHEILRGLRRVVDGYPGERVLVGEVNIRSTERVLSYYGAGDELHLAFNFTPLDAPWDPILFRTCIHDVQQWLPPAGAWPTWVLSNHDNPRQRSRYRGSLGAAHASAVLLLTLRGTPFIYQGEELGLLDAQIDAAARSDPGGRDGCRAPIPWQAAPPHGWEGAAPWLPFPPEADSRAAELQRTAADSTFALYRRLLAARKASAALRLGGFEELAAHPELMVYRRQCEGDVRLICINFVERAHACPHGLGWSVQVASDGAGEGQPFDGTLRPLQAVLLRPHED